MAYTFERDGTWGNYDDGISGPDFDKTIKRLGFTNSRTFEFILGSGTMYSRSETKIKWPYAFVCKLSLSTYGSFYHVWIKNLPAVFMFLREIGASKSESYVENHIEGLIDYLRHGNFDEAMEAISDKLRKGT